MSITSRERQKGRRAEAIEQDAETLLAEFASGDSVVITPPIPIEDIVEKHLKLGFEFDDTHRLFGVPRSSFGPGQGSEILGAIFFDTQRIVIDQSLDPEENPQIEGRFRSVHYVYVQKTWT